MNIKPNKQPCPICKNHKGGTPLMIRDDNAEKHPYTHICNCPYCGRFLAENTAKEYDEMRAARQEVKSARKLVEQAKDTERELAAFYALGKQLINARQNKRVIAPLFEELERLVNAYKF